MVDRVKPLKIEDLESGSQDDQGYPTQMNPDEDYASVKGISFQNSNEHLIDVEDDEIAFLDPINKRVKLSQPLGELKRLARDLVILSLEVLTLKGQEIDSTLSFFIDSFDNTNNINFESTNYFVNLDIGYVGLVESGNLTVTDTTIAQFDQGTFTNTESFNEAGTNGELRKVKVVDGNVNLLEDFEDISNISVLTPTTTQISQSSVQGTFLEGSSSLKIDIDFSGISEVENSIIRVDLGASGLDISSYKYLKIVYLKQEDNIVNYALRIQDTSGNLFTYPPASLNYGYLFSTLQKNLSEAFPSINENSVRYIDFSTQEVSSGQLVFDMVGERENDLGIERVDFVEQQFVPLETKECKRIRLVVRRNNDTNSPLYVGLANTFGSTLTMGRVQVDEASDTYQTVYISFDDTVTVVANNTYSIVMKTDATVGEWEIQTYRLGDYTFRLLVNEVEKAAYKYLDFTLYTPAVIESIFIDKLEIEAESTYQSTGSFLSRAIDLGQVPSSLGSLYWEEEDDTDNILVEIRFAATEAGLTSAIWSTQYTDPSGAGNNLSGLTPNRWFQYRIYWTGSDPTGSTVIKEVSLDYTTSAGSGNAIVISEPTETTEVPTKYMVDWIDELNSGAINYYVSRDNKATWISVPQSDKRKVKDFTGPSGTFVCLRAIITGNARLHGWSVYCDKDLL